MFCYVIIISYLCTHKYRKYGQRKTGKGGDAKNGAYPPTQNGHIRSLLSGRCHDSSFTLQI
jgi:hypothetical protein